MRAKFDVKQIVDQLFDFLELLMISKAQPYVLFNPELRHLSETKYYYQIRKFKKYGLIKKVKRNRRYVYEITEKAKQIRQGTIKKVDRKDGQSTIILFDIPETKYKARKAFRRFLLKSGYTQIQKSVFISPFEVFDELKQIIEELRIGNDVTFISGKIDRG